MTAIDHDARIEDIDWMLHHGEHPDRPTRSRS